MKTKNSILLILFIALLLRLVSVNQSLWMDEAISAVVVKNYSLLEIITRFAPADTHPPLYYMMLRLWTLVFNYSEISLRFPSVIFGVLTVFIVYKIGERFSKKTAIYSTLLTSIAPLLIYYSQEARMYSLSTLLTAMVVLIFLKKQWLTLSVLILLLAITDYLPLLVLLPFWIYLVSFERNKKNILKFIKASIPTIIFIMFWFPTFLKQSLSTSTYLTRFPAWEKVLGTASIKDLLLVWVKFILGRIDFENINIYLLIIVMATIVFCIPLYYSIIRYKKIAILWLWLIMPVLLAFLGAFFIPGFSYFRLIFVLPALYILVSYGISEMKYGKIFIIIIIFMNLSFSLIYLLNSKYWREDWRNSVTFIENRLKNDEVILVSYPEPFTPYVWYSKKDSIYSFNTDLAVQKGGIFTLDYLMDLTDPNRENYEKLEEIGFKNKEVYNFRGVGQIRYWTKN